MFPTTAEPEELIKNEELPRETSRHQEIDLQAISAPSEGHDPDILR